MGIEDFRIWLEGETANIMEPLDEQSRKLIGKIEEKLEDARTTCMKLEQEGVKQMEKGKAVRKAKLTQKLSRYFLKQTNGILFPSQISFSGLKDLHQSLDKTISSIMRERSVWFPRISPLFIIARKKVDFALSRLVGSVSELDAFLSTDYLKARDVEELFSGTDALLMLTEKLHELEKRKSKTQREFELRQRKLGEIKEDMESVKGRSELNNLAETNLRVQQLRVQAKHAFRHLRKPFAKFVNMTRGPGYSLSSEESERLDLYLEDPFRALAAEKPGLPTLKSILTKVDRAMQEAKLKLKGSRMRKGREKIDGILNGNALDELYRDCVRTLSLSSELISSKETQVAQRESKQLQRRAVELRRRMETLEGRLKTIERRYEELLGKVSKEKAELEKSTSNVLGKTVKIRLT